LSVVAESRRFARRAIAIDIDPDERRGWLSNGLAALIVSGLGLAVAGSVALTTNAEISTAADDRLSSTVSMGDNQPLEFTDKTTPSKKVTDSASLRAFGTRTSEIADDPPRTPELQIALINERAAQRAEDLSKTAEDVSRAGLDASSQARAESLAEADRQTRKAAVQLAQERLRRAIAERIAAESRRQQAESGRSSTTTETNSQTGSFGNGNISTGGAVSPVPGAVIGAYFGQYGVWSRYHTGLDFRASYGTPIRAVKAGVVVFAGNSGDWAGNHVAIKHGDGMTTMSSHMSSIAVGSGQTVRAGQIIGYVGQSGRAFGAHLHFELYPAGVRYGDVYRAINPQPWLSAAGVQTH
jgi:murein DD-endopeptidase MepM/ murein hydrolase activator NlpD